MKKILRSRIFILILGIIAVLTLVYLVAGITSLEFRQADPLQFDSNSSSFATSEGSFIKVPLGQIIFVITVLAVLAFVVIFIFASPEQRKRLILAMLKWGILILLFYFFASRYVSWENVDFSLLGEVNETLDSNMPLNLDATPAPFVSPEVSPWISYGVALVVILAILLVIWLFVRRYNARRVTSPMGELAEIAQSALEEIQTGEDWQESVVQCYFRMNTVVKRQYDIKREVDVTPSEFAAQLEKAGLPGESVHRLTTLFERVRYGAKNSREKDIAEAVACLTDILSACQEVE